MAAGIITLTSSTFDETVNSSSTPILVDFWAEWCGPCKQMNPILSSIAEEKANDLAIAKVDIDAYGEIASRFNIMSIPTLLLFKDGELVWEYRQGAIPKTRLLQELTPFLPIS